MNSLDFELAIYHPGREEASSRNTRRAGPGKNIHQIGWFMDLLAGRPQQAGRGVVLMHNRAEVLPVVYR
jgi:hypothetical protein